MISNICLVKEYMVDLLLVITETHKLLSERVLGVFIHSNLISCALIGSLVNTRSVLKMSHCTPRTAPRLREVLLVRDRAHERHIDWSIFIIWIKLLIFFMFRDILKPFYLQFLTNMSKGFCFSVVYELG